MFTPIHTSLGAWLLYQGSSGLLIHNGAVFGISSLISGAIFNPSRDNIPIIAGLVSSILPVYLLAPNLLPEYPIALNSWTTAATTFGVGLLLGWGTKVSRKSRTASSPPFFVLLKMKHVLFQMMARLEKYGIMLIIPIYRMAEGVHQDICSAVYLDYLHDH